MDNILEAGDMISCFTFIKGEEYMLREKLFKKLFISDTYDSIKLSISILNSFFIESIVNVEMDAIIEIISPNE